MAPKAISVEGLGKQYRLGSRQQSYQTIREAIVDTVTAPFRRLSSVVHNQTPHLSQETIWALKDVTFEVDFGEVVGIIGRNGAGKSTLLKILAQITEPTEGCARILGRVGSLLEIGTGFHPELSGRENIYLSGAILGMKKAEIDRKFDEIVDFAEVDKFVDTSMKFYSSGMGLKLAFAVAAHLEPDILLVDEILAVGDAAFRKKCLNKMGDITRIGRTVLFVSHNMSMIKHLCQTSILIQNGKIAKKGSTEEVVEEYELSFINSNEDQDTSVLFEIEQTKKHSLAVEKIEMMDLDQERKQVLRTWEDVCFRIHFYTEEPVPRAFFVMRIFSLEGDKLALMRSDHCENAYFALKPGKGIVDCTVRRLPLTAGTYRIGAVLKSKRGYAPFNDNNLGLLHVEEADVYNCGHAPTSKRSLIAVEQQWVSPEDNTV